MRFLNRVNPPLDSLQHYGVKGMRWGVRKDRDSSGKGSGSGKPDDAKNKAALNEATKEYMAIKEKPRSPKEAEKNLRANEAKSLDKLKPSVSKKEEAEAAKQDKTFWERNKKTIITYGVYAALFTGLMLASRKMDMDKIKDFKQYSGKAISLEKFQEAVAFSKFKTWGLGGYVQESSWSRPEFSLPAGHTFHRISTSTEKTFRDGGTYATHSIEDFHRYVAGFRQELGDSAPLNHVTWKATKDIKVPNLTTTVESLREVLSVERGGAPVSRKEALAKYQEMSGGSWATPTAAKFFDTLRGKGFGAIVDEMDAGVIGETPLVFFSKDVTPPKGVAKITKSAIKKAESSLIELNNRKF